MIPIWSKVVTSEVEQWPRLITAGYRGTGVNGLKKYFLVIYYGVQE